LPRRARVPPCATRRRLSDLAAASSRRAATGYRARPAARAAASPHSSPTGARRTDAGPCSRWRPLSPAPRRLAGRPPPGDRVAVPMPSSRGRPPPTRLAAGPGDGQLLYRLWVGNRRRDPCLDEYRSGVTIQMPIAGYLHHRVVADGEEAPRGVVHERRRQRGHHDGGQPIAAANPLSYTKSPVVPGRLSSAASAVALIARVSAVPPASPMLPLRR
jgi:hypothetical protein